MEKVEVTFIGEFGCERSFMFPSKTAQRKARTFLKESYKPSFSGERFTDAECEDQGWTLSIDCDLKVTKN